MPLLDEKFIDVSGIRTRYFEKGEGDPLVLFHGGEFGYKASSDCADDWDLNFDGLSKWFHVYAVDKLGQGYWGRMAIVDTKPFKLRVILHRIFVERPQVTGIPAWPGGAACYRRSRYIL